MTTVLVWALFICIGLVLVTLFLCLLFFIGAVFYGLYRGVRDLIRGRNVQVQDKAVSPPIRGAQVPQKKGDPGWGPPDGASNRQN